MKNLLLIFVCILSLTGSLFAQTSKEVRAPTADDSYRLGSRTVRIPAPDKFTDTMVLYPHIAQILIVSESPGNEVLAAHVADEILPQIKGGAMADLPFYTKVSVMKRVKEMDAVAADFQAAAASIEKQAPTLLTEDGPALNQANKNIQGGLSKLYGTDVGISVSEPKVLGAFNKSSDVISILVLMKVKTRTGEIPLVSSMSLLLVNKRLIFLYAYRAMSGEDDLEILRDFTKAWTAKTVAANK
jgi:hypothetical protein